MSSKHVRALLMSAALAPLSVLAADAPAPVKTDAPAPAKVAAPVPSKPDADWSDSIKQPTNWLKLGADLRLRNEYVNNAVTLDGNAPGHEKDFQRIRTRVSADVQPCKEFEFYTRLAWEGRHYTQPDSGDSWPEQDIIFDNLFVKLNLGTKDVGITTTIGRQDIIFGNGWLILDGTTLDGSRTIYFDALRTQFDFKTAKTTFDLIYINQPARNDAWFHPIYYTPKITCEENAQSAIGYLTNRCNDAANVEAYFIWKGSDAIVPTGISGDLYTIGGALSGKFAEKFSYRAEAAGQWGQRNGENDNAFGFNGFLTYSFKDQMNNRLTAGYEYLSGDDQGSDTYEGFDSVWGRWPQWSELYVYTYIPENGRVAQVTNLHRLWFGWDIDPIKKLGVQARYHALFAPEQGPATPMFDDSGNFRGHLFTLMVKYTFNKHVSAHALFEEFLPGDFYSDSNNDAATYFRVELNFTL